MKQYFIGEEGIKKFRKRYYNIFLPVVAIGAAIPLTINLMSIHASDGYTPWIVFGAMAVYLGFSVTRIFKKQKKMLESYRLTITENEIVREQMNTPALTINFMEVKEIMKTRKGSFLVRGVSRTDLIQIPYWVDDLDGIEQQLQTFSTVTTAKSFMLRQYGVLAIRLAALGMLIAISTVNDKAVVTILGAVLIGLIIWGLNELRVNKNVTVNAKRRSMVVYTLIAIVVVFEVVSKFWLYPG
ncbi:hypothetical protein ACQ86N_00540 [Puia sp. P3]|uniref:hypothetical protein n=1 Tax=Puia sp. P3 TaxID=3423952 RepID=UPI003D677B85